MYFTKKVYEEERQKQREKIETYYWNWKHNIEICIHISFPNRFSLQSSLKCCSLKLSVSQFTGGNAICSFFASLVDRHGKSMPLVCLKNYKSHHPKVVIYFHILLKKKKKNKGSYILNKPLKKGQTWWCLRILHIIWTLQLFLKRQESHRTLQQIQKRTSIPSWDNWSSEKGMWFSQDDLYLPMRAYSPPFLGCFAQSSQLCMVSFLFSWFLEAVLLFHYPGK